jgi:tRNA modification GTPase
VGKSTLGNRVLGRAASIVADLPGTTRDWVAGLAEFQGVAVRWLDTPGVRATDDPVEARAIGLASRVIAGADVLIAMRDDASVWPDKASLPREPDLWVVNKIDRGAAHLQTQRRAIGISAETGAGVEELLRQILAVLGVAGVREERWAFSDRLKALVAAGDTASLSAYVSWPRSRIMRFEDQKA